MYHLGVRLRRPAYFVGMSTAELPVPVKPSSGDAAHCRRHNGLALPAPTHTADASRRVRAALSNSGSMTDVLLLSAAVCSRPRCTRRRQSVENATEELIGLQAEHLVSTIALFLE